MALDYSVLLFRFFVIRDGFLLYYQENEKKDMERRGCLNIHPKVNLTFPFDHLKVNLLIEVSFNSKIYTNKESI